VRTGTTENPFGYNGAVGYYTNGETNDLYVRARTYDPLVARWLARDTIAFVGTAGVYDYVWSNPINHSDPSGEWPLCNAEYCTRWGPHHNYKGLYGIRAELITAPNQCCDGAVIKFHWKETHEVPPWAKREAGTSGCGEPANRELNNGFLWPFRFGNIDKPPRNCSKPIAISKRIGKCWVITIDWECPSDALKHEIKPDTQPSESR